MINIQESNTYVVSFPHPEDHEKLATITFYGLSGKAPAEYINGLIEADQALRKKRVESQ